jgi:hypothetical protein
MKEDRFVPVNRADEYAYEDAKEGGFLPQFLESRKGPGSKLQDSIPEEIRHMPIEDILAEIKYLEQLLKDENDRNTPVRPAASFFDAIKKGLPIEEEGSKNRPHIDINTVHYRIEALKRELQQRNSMDTTKGSGTEDGQDELPY